METYLHPCTHCGDANDDGTIDISDAVYVLDWGWYGGPAPGDCGDYRAGRGDANGDEIVDISDVVYLVDYIFTGGPCPHCSAKPCWAK